MNVMKNDKVILIQEYDNLKMIGETYEVANITDTTIVVRDAISKIAVAAINIDKFDTYFQKAIIGWTKWEVLNDCSGLVGYYRTNGKKVQVKTITGCRGEASCNKQDVFNLATGIKIAYERSHMKWLAECHKKLYKRIDYIEKKMRATNKRLKHLLSDCNVSNDKEDEK